MSNSLIGRARSKAWSETLPEAFWGYAQWPLLELITSAFESSGGRGEVCRWKDYAGLRPTFPISKLDRICIGEKVFGTFGYERQLDLSGHLVAGTWREL